MIMFQHSVFALPFALMSLITASGDGWPRPWVWLWVVVAMVAARTAAMAFNRLVDHRIDAENPRTRSRTLPAGRLSRRFAWVLTIASIVAFVVAAGLLNRLCLILATPALIVILGYSFAKRFTALSHLWLGLGLGIAPPGAWIAVTGTLPWPPVVLSAAVMLWVAGFDVVYSLQDETFDRAHGLHSLPSRLGGRAALVVARLLHLAGVVGFAGVAVAAGGGARRLGAVAAAAALLVFQHRLVSADDLSRVDAAFFGANGTLSIVMLLLFAFAKILAT